MTDDELEELRARLVQEGREMRELHARQKLERKMVQRRRNETMRSLHRAGIAPAELARLAGLSTRQYADKIVRGRDE